MTAISQSEYLGLTAWRKAGSPSPEYNSGKAAASPAGPVPHANYVLAPTNPSLAQSGPASRKRIHSAMVWALVSG